MLVMCLRLLKMVLSKDVETIGHVPTCLRHEMVYVSKYSTKYDSYYCEKCNRWLEEPCRCGGADCKWFPNRPCKPLVKESL